MSAILDMNEDFEALERSFEQRYDVTEPKVLEKGHMERSTRQ